MSIGHLYDNAIGQSPLILRKIATHWPVLYAHYLPWTTTTDGGQSSPAVAASLDYFGWVSTGVTTVAYGGLWFSGCMNLTQYLVGNWTSISVHYLNKAWCDRHVRWAAGSVAGFSVGGTGPPPNHPLYIVNHKKRDILFLTITLASHNRFLYFLHNFNLEKILHAIVVKCTTSP